CWSTTGSSAPPPSSRLPGNRPLEALARWLSAYGEIRWCHLPRSDSDAVRIDRGCSAAALGAPNRRRAADAHFRRFPPELPACPPGIPYRLKSMGAWAPTQVRLLYRHL